MERLDEVVEGQWTDFYSIGINGGVECRLTVCGVTRSDVGTADDNEKEKSAYSDAFKRAAVKFGIGRFLYDLPKMWAECTKKNGKYWNMNPGEMERMQADIQKYLGKQKPAPVKTSQQPAQPQAEPKPAPGQSVITEAGSYVGNVDPALLVKLGLSENVPAAGQLLTKLKLAGHKAAEALPIIRKYRAARDAGKSSDEAAAIALA
jgi:hypothetical protein